MEERRKKLKELKGRTKCSACGEKGHWAGDQECKKNTKGQGKGKPAGFGFLGITEESERNVVAEDTFCEDELEGVAQMAMRLPQHHPLSESSGHKCKQCGESIDDRTYNENVPKLRRRKVT